MNYHSDYNSAPALLNNSSLVSQSFGAAILTQGYVGQSKSHEVQIIK